MYFKAKNMDKNIHFLSQKTPENSPDFFSKKPKNSLKKKWGFYAFPVLVLVVAIWYGGYIRLFATGTGIAPNTVLDPSCAPGEDGCYVQVLPVQNSSSSAGKILGSDGVNTLWVDQNGGIFPYAGSAVTATGWAAVEGKTLGSTSTTLAAFIKSVFFPDPHVVVVTTSTVIDFLGSSPTLISHTDTLSSTSTTTGPIINSFMIAAGTATSSSPTGCTPPNTPATSLTGCDQINSNNHLVASWSVQTGTTTLSEIYVNHYWYVLTETSHFNTYWDGVLHSSVPTVIGTVTSTTPCATACTTYSTASADNGDGTSSTQNTFPTVLISVLPANNIGTIKVRVASTPTSSTGIDGINSNTLTSIGAVSNPVDSRNVLALADTTGYGSTTSYDLQVNSTGACTTSCSTTAAGRQITFTALKAYIFADTVDKDYTTITTTSTAAFSALASSPCTTTGVNCYVSSPSTSTREADFNGVYGKNVWYAYPKSLGALDYTSMITGMKVSTDDGFSFPHNNEFSQSDIWLTSGGGVSTEYYLYGFDYSAGFGGISSTDAWIKYP